ncbi:uracil-DNA glycosylase [Phenylobacterium montanum]|uniref:Type-4 uracil-DNA glycosylase n=1 Tax=Phenylobacterium montanum TaxID=2823693 RepID=A0A975G135_9CAUL|nr:uracil-DNA glycosylase [Caulobacter sp. S6]QUD88612.1 uracil-DNA glycosylase [Caulobacter sp. S6]
MSFAAIDPRAAESLLAFWAEAGVDQAYADEPVDRLAEALRPRLATPAHAPAPAAPAAAPAPDIAEAIADARRLAAEAKDLADLAAAIAAFEGCPLKREGARQAVFARGAPDAPVMIIGEAPGAEEDQQGAPFVGRAGKLLDRMVAAAGLEGRVFITNTVYWRPPGNRTPSPQEQMICAPFLERAIELVSPKLLLLVGGASAKSVLQRSEGILTLRGRWFDWRPEGGQQAIPALPTLHPAFLLRQPAAKKKAWADLLTLTERLDRPERPGA